MSRAGKERDRDVPRREPSPPPPARGLRALGATLASGATSLSLTQCALGPVEMQQLVAALETARVPVRSLDLSCNMIGDDGVKVLTDSAVSRGLAVLRLGRNGLRDASGPALCALLRATRALVALDVSDNELGELGARALATGLEGNTSVQSVHIEDNKLRDGGATFIAAALAINPCVTSLNLCNNGIAAAGADALGKLLQRSEWLRDLRLHGNALGVGGARALATGLASSKSLTVLDLSQCSLCPRLDLHGVTAEDGICILADALRRNSSLMRLSLGGNKSSDQSMQALARVLKVNKSLSHLILDRYDNLSSLASAFPHNTTLVELAAPDEV